MNVGPCSSIGNVLLGNGDSSFLEEGEGSGLLFSAVSQRSPGGCHSTLSLVCCTGLFQRLNSQLSFNSMVIPERGGSLYLG